MFPVQQDSLGQETFPSPATHLGPFKVKAGVTRMILAHNEISTKASRTGVEAFFLPTSQLERGKS